MSLKGFLVSSSQKASPTGNIVPINPSTSVKQWAKRLECPVDIDANYENTYWCNRDLIPIPHDRRTWTWQGFGGYWIIAGINTTAWTVGSTLLELGLSVGQAMGTVIGASIFIALLAVGAGWMGSHQYIGFTVTSRSSWGMRGAFWPVLNRVMTGCIWMGIQMYWGGQAVRILLGGIIGPKFINMKNTLPVSANVETVDLISFFIFAVIIIPILWIRPEKLQLPFRIAFIMITSVLFGMLIWALVTADGAGPLLRTGSTLHGSTLSWNTVYGLQSLLGGYGSGCLGQSDWTRYSKDPNAALFGQAIAAPLTICVTALCGILITSASAKIYGSIFWNPFHLLLHAQQSMTPLGRAGTFFAGLGLLASQLALCVVLNSVAAGMDLTTLCPKYINLRRGAYIITIIGIAVCPWNYVNKASTFLSVLSGWSVFLSPMTGVLIADYFLIRKRELHLGDLYVGNCTSAYWYTAGFNWRAITSWAMGLWPLLPGFVQEIRGTSNQSGWDHLYEISYFAGFVVSFVVYLVLNALFPIRGRTGSSPFLHKGVGVLAASEDESSGLEEGSKGGEPRLTQGPQMEGNMQKSG